MPQVKIVTFTGFLVSYGFSRFKNINSWPIADEVFTHFPFLHGIDAPEFKQMCKKPYLTIIFFTFTKDYPCGKISTQKLQKKINNKVITCKILDIDRYKRLIGECYKRNLNLNSWLVSNGYAVAYRKYSKKYISNEINAKNEKKGIWQGKFEMPWEFRRKK